MNADYEGRVPTRPYAIVPISMLIILGGFLGSGRDTLARAVAAKNGFHYYDVDQKKFHTGEYDKKGIFHEKLLRPFGEQARLDLCERVAEDLPMLSKLYDTVILDGPFHEAKVREYFFSTAKTY